MSRWKKAPDTRRDSVKAICHRRWLSVTPIERKTFLIVARGYGSADFQPAHGRNFHIGNVSIAMGRHGTIAG
ncbi:hypothetical protein GWI33_002617 [Rhynchophorus ferrugineus]|uniref:Uncharacterized protein n=1 Tax=Rhynchophorus ferrugineus TaxID=354439 RepID=A0A834M351_RHYFE|nr:hypothetical protein GWI33_002617 [Rhynchophorus ferrugineus]